MEVEQLKTEDLAGMAAPYNPRRMSEHDLTALRRSMKSFGVVEPVVVNRRTGRIVGGHQRVKAAEAEGIEKLPVVHVDLDEPSEKQLNLALNRISGDWNEGALARILAELQATGTDMEQPASSPARSRNTWRRCAARSLRRMTRPRISRRRQRRSRGICGSWESIGSSAGTRRTRPPRPG